METKSELAFFLVMAAKGLFAPEEGEPRLVINVYPGAGKEPYLGRRVYTYTFDLTKSQGFVKAVGSMGLSQAFLSVAAELDSQVDRPSFDDDRTHHRVPLPSLLDVQRVIENAVKRAVGRQYWEEVVTRTEEVWGASTYFASGEWPPGWKADKKAGAHS